MNPKNKVKGVIGLQFTKLISDDCGLRSTRKF